MKKKILIIDNEESFIEMVKMNLEASGGYEVCTENMGSYGLSRALSFKPDLIFLDIIMGDMDGLEVAERLRHNEETKHIPIIYVTAILKEEEEKKSKSYLEGLPFLSKPVTVERLIECIEQNIKK